MRIATWNVERLRHRASLDEMRGLCESLQADILVLTETDSRLLPEYHCAAHTPLLYEQQPDYYKPTENRVSVFTNYKCVSRYSTYDERTAICVELKTEYGNMLVYGTIMGIYGNRHPNFKSDLASQIADFKRLSAVGKPLCVLGDYNLSFSDNYYFTTHGRDSLLNVFKETNLQILTRNVPESIDHIAINEDVVRGREIAIQEWNKDKRLSDHKGIMVSF